VEYEEKMVKLQQDDRILFYTDGIVEAKNENKEQFGLDRLISVIENNQENPIETINKEITIAALMAIRGLTGIDISYSRNLLNILSSLLYL